MSSRRTLATASATVLVATSALVVTATGSAEGRAGAASSVSAYCSHGSTKAFTPTFIRIPGITRGARVLALPRRGAPRVRSAPVTRKGAREFAWDAPRPKPGARRGNVRLNAHTWPWSDPIALGNDMLRRLRPGDRIVVRGKRDGHAAHLCYRVTRQVEIRVHRRYRPYFSTDGSPKLAIMVCSGTRRGPGNWDHRMIWYAAPYGLSSHRAQPKPKPGPSPTPPPAPSGLGGLVGGLLGG